jgi:hypothetical protein
VYKDGFRFHPGKDNEELWFLLTKSNRISNALSPCKKPLHFFDRPEIVAKQEKETITQEQKLFKAIIDKPNEESVRAIYNAVGLPEEENFDVVQTALWKWAKASKDNEKRFWELDADAGFRQYLENIEEGKRLKVLTNNPDGWRVKGVPGKWMGVMTEHQLAKKLVDDTVKYKILLNAIEHAPEQVEV